MSSYQRAVAAMIVVSMVLATSFFLGKQFSPAARRNRDVSRSVRQEAIPRPGRQLVLVYVGSSRCGPSNQPDVVRAVGTAIRSLRQVAEARYTGFVAIGIARELSPVSGLQHLQKLGQFDELAVGQGDLNQASMRMISVDHPGIGATPQLIVLERELHSQGASIDNVNIEERVLLRRVGASEITRWVARGAPTPSSTRRSVTKGEQEP
jgi:hypothetical protein